MYKVGLHDGMLYYGYMNKMTNVQWLLKMGLWNHTLIYMAEAHYEFKYYYTPRIILLNCMPNIPFS